MNIQNLTKKLDHLKGVAFNLVYIAFRDKLIEKGLTDDELLEFSIMDRIKNDIELELVSFILRNEIGTNVSLDSVNNILFNVVPKVHEKYTFLSEPTTEFFHRKCSATNEVFSEGFVTNSDMYFKYSKDLVVHLRELQTEEESKLSDLMLIEKAYDEDYCYHTAWEDASDLSYAVDSNGNIHTLND